MSEIPGLLGPQGVGYIDLADAALIAKDEKRRSGPRTHNPLRPSAAGFCARKLAYEFNEYRGNAEPVHEEQSPDLQRIFETGHALEYMLIRMWKQVEIFQIKYTQQAMTFHKFGDNEIIEGSNDLCVYIPGHKVIGDWKSKGDRFSSYRDSKWTETDEELRNMKSVQVVNDRVYWVADLPAFLKELKDPHFRQNFVQLNLYATNEFMVSRGIDHACIWQIDKNKSRLREIRFKPSTEVKDYVINKFDSIINAVDVDKNPELIAKEAFLGSSLCAYCVYAKRCWPEADAKKESYKYLPPKRWPRDTNRMNEQVGQELEQLYAAYKDATAATEEAVVIEDQICKVLHEQAVDKIRFEDGCVFELKFLKSPKPHYELRRGKL